MIFIKKEYLAIGVMSGTSLDGLDIAFCRFRKEGEGWDYELLKAKTIPYDENWRNRLSGATDMSINNLVWFDRDFGSFMAEEVHSFVKELSLHPEVIGSHGHTILHRPEFGFTSQLGHGAALCAGTGIPVVADFRSMDLALNGQGAPLVPLGDHWLFGEYAGCLNLGGIANVSCSGPDGRIAYDICPVNMLLNFLAAKAGKDYDHNGKGARKGQIHELLLEKLNALPYYKRPSPKSMGREWFEKQVNPLFDAVDIPLKDLFYTAYEHITTILSRELNDIKGDILVTGGGALNTFLVEKLRKKTRAKLVIPEEDLIHFKEAIIFAFMAVLRLRGEINTYASATGADKDSCGGCLWIP